MKFCDEKHRFGVTIVTKVDGYALQQVRRHAVFMVLHKVLLCRKTECCHVDEKLLIGYTE